MLSRPLADRYGPLIVLSYTLLFSMPLMLALTYPFFADLKAASYGPAVWAAIFWALVVCSFCGWLVWTWVNSVRGIARSAPFMYLMPPVAGVMAWLTLGETFTWAKIARRRGDDGGRGLGAVRRRQAAAEGSRPAGRRVAKARR